MAAAGLGDVALVGTSALKADAFLTATAGVAEGTIVTCGCVDLASSTDPEAGRFIHDFQSEYGTPPGPYAAEAWDAGGMLAGGFARGGGDRVALSDALDRAAYRGIANTYRFADDGQLDVSSAELHVFRAEGIRWVPVGERTVPAELPVGTPGYLSMAACRTGRPFAYRHAGHLEGFEVELARAIARRLRLSLSWSEPPCGVAMAQVTEGSLDAVIAASADVPQGVPTTGIALSIHGAIVATREAASGSGPFLDRLKDGDVVGVLGDRQLRSWARAAILGTGGSLRILTDPGAAYRKLTHGRLTAVVVPEADAWAAVERRPGLAVAQGVDVGAHDVIVAKGPDAVLVAAIDAALGSLIRSGRYTLLFAKYFPGAPVPPETGA